MPRTATSAFSLDANGCLIEHVETDGQKVVIHYDDILESDITVTRGLWCTTPLRTVIDVAVEVGAAHLELMVQDCLDRGLFTREQALARIAEPDMQPRVGARMLRQVLGS